MAPASESGAAGSSDQSRQPRDDSPASSAAPSSARAANSGLAQALKDLARGEQAANTLEADLSRFEQKLDDMLLSFGVDPSENADEVKASKLGDKLEKNGEKKSEGGKEG